MENNERKAISIIVGVIISVLCISLYFWVKGSEFDDNTVVIIKDTSTMTSTELTESSITSTLEKTITVTTVSKTTKVKSIKKPLSAECESKSEIIETEIETVPLWININTADAEDFEMLSGIGEEIAERIIEYREIYGDFRNIEEIMNVKGIGEKKFKDICDYIYVDNPVYETEAEVEIEAETEKSTTEQITTNNLNTTIVIIETGIVTETITEEDLSESESQTEDPTENIFPIDINLAEKEDLMLLPYVTEEIAEKIIELRDNLQGFNNEYELLYIEELEQKEVSEIIKFVIIG